MYKPLSLYLALRYVSKRQGHGFSSFISASSTVGIALGVMVLIVVLSAMNGFERALAKQLLSVVPHGELVSVNKPIVQWQDAIKRVQQHQSVIAAAPVIKLTGMMQKGEKLKGVEIRGVDVKLEQQVSAISNYIKEGRWDNLHQGNTVILGSGTAKKLNVRVGDSLQLLLPQQSSEEGNNLASKFLAPKSYVVLVGGIFTFGGVIDDTLAYVSLAQARDYIGYQNDEVQGIRIKVSNVFQAPTITRDVAYQFDHYLYILDWTRTQGHLFNDIQLVRMVMNIVLVIVIAVASFNIVSTLIMTVNEKKGDIAILKTMGASSATVMLTFVIQGAVNGVVGSLAGALLGVYLALNLTDIVTYIEQLMGVKFLSADVYFIDFLPSYLHYPDVITTVIIALSMSLLATVYPAWQATKVQPAYVLGQL